MPVHHKVFEGVNHLDLLRTDPPTQAVADIISNLNKELNRWVLLQSNINISISKLFF